MMVCKMSAEEIAGSACEARAFEVTLLTPGGSRVIRALATEHIWNAAMTAGITLPAIFHQGRCLTCASKLVEPGEFDPSDAVSYYPQDREWDTFCFARQKRARICTSARTCKRKCALIGSKLAWPRPMLK